MWLLVLAAVGCDDASSNRSEPLATDLGVGDARPGAADDGTRPALDLGTDVRLPDAASTTSDVGAAEDTGPSPPSPDAATTPADATPSDATPPSPQNETHSVWVPPTRFEKCGLGGTSRGWVAALQVASKVTR